LELRIESALGIAQQWVLKALLRVKLGVELGAVLGAAQNGKAFRRELFSELVESIALRGSAARAGLLARAHVTKIKNRSHCLFRFIPNKILGWQCAL